MWPPLHTNTYPLQFTTLIPSTPQTANPLHMQEIRDLHFTQHNHALQFNKHTPLQFTTLPPLNKMQISSRHEILVAEFWHSTPPLHKMPIPPLHTNCNTPLHFTKHTPSNSLHLLHYTKCEFPPHPGNIFTSTSHKLHVTRPSTSLNIPPPIHYTSTTQNANPLHTQTQTHAPPFH